jgi:hypothetical protein
MEGNPLVRNANKNYYRLWKFKNLMGITNAKAKSVARECNNCSCNYSEKFMSLSRVISNKFFHSLARLKCFLYVSKL